MVTISAQYHSLSAHVGCVRRERTPACHTRPVCINRSVLVISHERWFLDRVATHILAFEGDSHVHWCPGNFQECEEDKKRRLGDDADQPHRIKYKKPVH